MKPSDHMQQIMRYLATVESATKQDIYDNVKFGYYHNWEKYVGETLSRMVKRQLVFRLKKGVYAIKPTQKQIIEQPSIGLFA
jgi:hypothetical protein